MVTAQARFRERYTRHVGEALLAAIAVHFLVFYLIPPFEFTPYEFRFEKPIEILPDPGIEPVIEEPKTVAQPRVEPVPVIEAGDGDEEIEIPKTSPIDPAEIDFTPMPKQEMEEFVPWDRMPVLVRAFQPDYPNLARAAGIEGRVLLRVTIGPDGRVQAASVIHSDVTPAMERAAIDAAMRFEFEPAMQQSVPVRSLMAVPVLFKLR